MGSPGNPLASLLGQYDSDNDSDEEAPVVSNVNHSLKNVMKINQEPLPPVTDTPVLSDSNTVLQCAWSACYDESSGYTYYWNQYTNQVTWEPPPDYLQAIKIASLQATKAQSEVSSEEWQMYQQVLAEQKATTKSKPAAPVLDSNLTKSTFDRRKIRRPSSDTEDEKIELITSYYNSDSESNDESDKVVLPAKVESRKSDGKHVSKKLKKKHEVPVGPVIEYGPSLPLTQQETTQIEQQFIPAQIVDTKPEEISASDKSMEVPVEEIVDSPQEVVLATNDILLSNGKADTEKENTPDSSPKIVEEDNPESEDSQDESVLIRKLAEKTEILKNLGGEVPTEIDDLLKCETESPLNKQIVSTQGSPKAEINESVIQNDLHKEVELFEKSIDEMLAEIESKEMKKKQTLIESDNEVKKSVPSPSHIMEDPKSPVAIVDTDHLNPSSVVAKTPLFPSARTTVLFPSAQNISKIASPELMLETDITEPSKSPSREPEVETEVANIICLKKGANLYMRSPSEEEEIITTKRKKRIATDVLPEVKKEKKIEKSAAPSYTTKYSQYIEGFSSERTGLGFSNIADQDEMLESDKKKAFVYGKYSKPVVMFTKGEVLNEEKKDLGLDIMKADTNCAEERPETSESLADTLQAKLNFLNQNAVELPPVQEMIIQFECLQAAWQAGALQGDYWRGRLGTWARALQDLEARAAPPGWLCGFQREEGRYQYKRVSDGFVQWDYPQILVNKEDLNDDDMDICTTPPPGDVLPDTTTPIPMHNRIPAVKSITQTIAAPIPIISGGKSKKTNFLREVENPPLPSSMQQSAAPPPPPSWDPAPPPPPPPPPSITPPPPPPSTSVRPPPPKTKRHASPPPPPPGTDEEEHTLYNLPAENERVESPPPPPPPPPLISQDPSLGDELMSFYSDLAELEKQPEPAPPESPYHPPEPSRPKICRQTEEDKILNSLWSTARKNEPAKKLAVEEVDFLRLKDSVDGTKIKKKTKVKLSASVGLKNKNVSSMVAKWQQVKEANRDDDD